mgnify:CR=1 FL=1
MSRRCVVGTLALAAAFATGCAEPHDAATPIADTTPTLTTHWWYVVSGATSATESRSATTTSEKDAVLARIRTLVTTHCPGATECRVGLQAMVCAPSIGGSDFCSTARIATHVGWQATVEALSTFQREQLAFLEQRNVPARWIEETLRYHRGYQSTVLAELTELGRAVSAERDRIMEAARDRLGAMGGAVQGQETVRLANLRWSIGELDGAAETYEVGLARVRPLYADIAQRFTAYRETEASAIATLQDLAARASGAELAGMAALRVELAVLSGDENRIPQQLIVDAERVRWELAYVQAEYDGAVAPHGEVLQAEGLTRLDHTTVPREGMGRVVHYAEQRIARVNAAVRELFEGLDRREEALVLIAADAATRDAAAAAAGAHAEARFLDDITARMAEMWRTPPTSAGLRLAILGERLRVMQGFLQLETLCAGGAQLATWRGPGCLRVANELPKVRRYLTQTLPFTIRYGITKLRTAGVAEAELAAIEAELVAGRIDAAVHRYDIAVRFVEEG